MPYYSSKKLEEEKLKPLIKWEEMKCCPKTGKLIDKPNECVGCECLLITISGEWACTFFPKSLTKGLICIGLEQGESY